MQRTLKDKKVALFGANGGLGVEISKNVLALGGELLAVVRNEKRAEELKEKLPPESAVQFIYCDLTDFDSVKLAVEKLKSIGVDVLLHNAGAYAIKKETCKTGYNNVFTINFLAPYYITKELIPTLSKTNGRVVAVGSIAHNYSKTRERDVDFSNEKSAAKTYGNAKRYLTFSLLELSKKEKDVSFSVTHPGITFTNITAHYPPLIFALIKHPMKIIFPSPKKAAKCIVEGFFTKTPAHSWIGPRLFNVWGKPKLKTLKTAKQKEIDDIFHTAEKIYKQIKNNP